jgi:uncharacterized protein YutE (UPF0331/DUF86 family)
VGSPVDPARIAEKARYVREQVDALTQLIGSTSVDEFAAPGSWASRGARYALLTAVEALVDIAYHLAAKRLDAAPADARDAFQRLRAAGLIEPEAVARVNPLIGFRNRVVHAYETVDDRRVYEMIADESGDLLVVLEALLRAAA